MVFSFSSQQVRLNPKAVLLTLLKMSRKRFVGKYLRQIINNASVLGAVDLFQDALSWLTKAFEFVISTSRDTCNVIGRFFFFKVFVTMLPIRYM